MDMDIKLEPSQQNMGDQIPEIMDQEDDGRIVTLPPGEEFSMDRLIYLMQTVVDSWDNNQTPIAAFSDMYIEWTKLFKHMGPTISLAFKGKLFIFSLFVK